MSRGYFSKCETESGTLVQNAFELIDGQLVSLSNRSSKLAVGSNEYPLKVLEFNMQKKYPNNRSLEVGEFDSYSGTYHPAIARPLNFNEHEMFNPAAETENELAKNYRREHATIARDIENCFDVASPAKDNFNVFGAQFEKIIYFACVGVESLFNKVLEDNGLNQRNTGMATFVNLKPHLRIDEYSLSLVYYPWISELIPFEGWDKNQPSKSLSWFDAYNSLKHDKRENLHKATMQNALRASAAYYILTFSVFGNQMFTGFLSEQFFFNFETKPDWTAAEQYYPTEGGWQPRKIKI